MLSPSNVSYLPQINGVFKVQFHNENLALKMPKLATKMPKWAAKMLKLVTCCSILVAKKTGIFNAKIYLLALLRPKKCQH